MTEHPTSEERYAAHAQGKQEPVTPEGSRHDYEPDHTNPRAGAPDSWACRTCGGAKRTAVHG